MTRRILTLGALLCIPLLAPRAAAQDRILDAGTTGVRESARFDDRTPRDTPQGPGILAAAPGAAAQRSYRVILTPSSVAAEDLLAYGANAALSTQVASVPSQFRLGYRRMSIEGADDLDRLTGQAKFRVVPARNLLGRTTSVSVSGDFSRTFEVADRFDANIAVERAIDRGEKLTLGLTGGYSIRDSEAGARLEDATVATGAIFALRRETELGIDYAFKNDIDGEDDYSLSVTQVLTPVGAPVTTNLVIGAGKHRVVFLTLVFVY